MAKFIIRNDDVGFDTKIEEIVRFCQICDKYGFSVIQAITPKGEVQKVRSRMTNKQIIQSSDKSFDQNPAVLEYLKTRHDLIGVHGLWHTHEPSEEEIATAKSILQSLGLNPTYFVPPFNEGNYSNKVCGLITCKLSQRNGERLEDFLKEGTPFSPLMYLHSWRFNNAWYTFDMLEKCLQKLQLVQ